MEDWKFPQSSVAGCRDDMVDGVIVFSYSSVAAAVVWCCGACPWFGCIISQRYREYGIQVGICKSKIFMDLDTFNLTSHP
eukprot:scaffold57952_cov59-Attheya_sp.AAC.3